MASPLDDDELASDDYYSLLNVRREVQNAAGIWMIACADSASVVL